MGGRYPCGSSRDVSPHRTAIEPLLTSRQAGKSRGAVVGTAQSARALVHFGVVPMRLGIFGGTFDPPHVGHMVAAVNVRRALCLDEVVLMVANDPWQKTPDNGVSPAVDRLAMTRAAARGVVGVSVRDDEIVRGGPTYTVDTLRHLRATSSLEDLQLFTVVGADAAANFHTWKNADEIATLSRIVVVNRADHRTLVSGGFECDLVEIPEVNVSSTDIRARVRRGEPISGLVRDEVARLIVERGLYRQATCAGAAS